MRCLVCHASWSEGRSCPRCGNDVTRGPADAQAVLHARETFKQASAAYAPGKRVSTRDKLKPWLALGLGMLLFVFWVKTCHAF
jgi:hypothetical protein